MSNTLALEADLHVHTVASGHAFSTIGEITLAAAAKGLKAVGMTDHGPALPGGPHPYHFAALRFIPEYLNGVRVLRGVEANILGKNKLDLPDPLLDRLDLVLAGFHEGCGFDNKGVKANTRAVLALMENPRVNLICHPGNPNFPLDYAEVVRQAAATRTALEINNASFIISRRGSVGNCRTIARLCAEHDAPIAVGSDSHIAQGVGEFTEALAVLQEEGVRLEQIVNRTLTSTLSFLGLDA
ncbi:MAG: PHP domain-containing protein [Desulfuromonadales bacterium]